MMAASGVNNSDWVNGLQSHVQAITLSLQAMMVLLVREREALVGRSEAQSLESIAQDKQNAVTQVSALYELLRNAVARNLGPDASLTDGMTALREQGGKIAKQIEELVQLTQKCQQANQDNGVLVSAGLDHSQQAMNTLTQVNAGPAAANTYSRSATQHAVGKGGQFTVRA